LSKAEGVLLAWRSLLDREPPKKTRPNCWGKKKGRPSHMEMFEEGRGESTMVRR